jgi:sodium/hydrogen exchanger 8
MSPQAQAYVPVVFRTLAAVAESAVFFLLGAAIFAFPQHMSIPFHATVVFAVLASRAVVVGVAVRFANRWRRKKISRACQTFVWYSGMRGAVSFGLVATLVEHCHIIGVPAEVSIMLMSTTLTVILFTILVLGGGATTVLKWLRLEQEFENCLTSPPDAQGLERDAEPPALIGRLLLWTERLLIAPLIGS